MHAHDHTIRDQLAELLRGGIPENAAKKLNKDLEDATFTLLDSMESWIKDELADNLSTWIEDCADRAIESMLVGNEEMFRQYLKAERGFGYTGRNGDHHVIRGKLFETGCIETRHKLAETYAALIKDERILDLEDQVRSLVKQVGEWEARNDRLTEELNNYRR